MMFNRKFFFALILVALVGPACAPKKPPAPIVSMNLDAAQEMKKYRGYWIEVQIPQRKLILANSDHIIKVYDIAVGEPRYPTPTGWRKIDQVIWNPWWHPPATSDWVEDPTPVPPRHPDNPLGEIKMPLGEGYLIHGTKAVHSIGRWASHGCIRMLFEDIFGLVELLMTEYSETSAIDSMEQANREPSKEFFIKLLREVPVHLTYDPIKVDKDNHYVTITPDIYNRQGDQAERIAEAIQPHVKKRKSVNMKKIRQVLKMFQGKTIHIGIDQLSM